MANASPINTFFASFAALGFTHNQRASLIHEFQRLEQLAKWDRRVAANMRHRFWDTIANEFTFLFGSEFDNLDHLQRLCALVRVHPIPESLGACKKVSCVLIGLCIKD
jgi:hypothetical protein